MPFGPAFHAMILEMPNGFGNPYIVFRIPHSEKWRLAELRYKRFCKSVYPDLSYYPMLSPLYRLKFVNYNEMKDEDDELLQIIKFVKDDKSINARIWNDWPSFEERKGYHKDISFDEVKELFKKIYI